jgi:hypothetical protein
MGLGNKLALAAASAASAALVAKHLAEDRADLSPATLEASIRSIASSNHSLDRDGVVIIRSVLSVNECETWARRVEAHCAGPSAKSTTALGRQHTVLHGREKNPTLLSLHRELEQIGHRPSLSDVASTYIPSSVISQCQLLLALPKSTNQIWHRDNSRAGLTALIALTDIRQGPTELLSATHASEWGNDVTARVLATLQKGDAVLYDSRVIHRGRGFDVGPNRPTLVLRWDDPATPAPGVGLVGTLVTRLRGSIISLMNS